jgi:hypothetical protein
MKLARRARQKEGVPARPLINSAALGREVVCSPSTQTLTSVFKAFLTDRDLATIAVVSGCSNFRSRTMGECGCLSQEQGTGQGLELIPCRGMCGPDLLGIVLAVGCQAEDNVGHQWVWPSAGGAVAAPRIRWLLEGARVELGAKSRIHPNARQSPLIGWIANGLIYSASSLMRERLPHLARRIHQQRLTCEAAMNTNVARYSAKWIAVCGAIAVFTVTSQSAYADRCGRRDRVPLPGCVVVMDATTSPVAGLGIGVVAVKNLCSFPVTVKLDLRDASDALLNVSPGQQINQPTGGARLRAASCCPRYSRCN